jgi:hypothetical protein
MKMKLQITENDLVNIEGILIDVLENFAENNNIQIPSAERDETIAEGEDPDELAIIFGESYVKLTEPIERDFILDDNKNRVMEIDDAADLDEIADTFTTELSNTFKSMLGSDVKLDPDAFIDTEDAIYCIYNSILHDIVDYNKLSTEERDTKTFFNYFTHKHAPDPNVSKILESIPTDEPIE